MRRLAAGFPGTSAMYVESLTSGAAAAWNARATFPGASTLKLAIAVTLLARGDGPPAFGSTVDRLMRGMLILSDNEAANRALVLLGGSTSGGGQLVNAELRSIGLERTEMYGGYLIGTSLEATREPPMSQEACQPSARGLARSSSDDRRLRDRIQQHDER